MSSSSGWPRSDLGPSFRTAFDIGIPYPLSSSALAYLAPENLKVLTDNPDPDIWLLDVRPEAGYLSGHIPTALSFPSSTIGSRLDELPLDQYLIIYCETGIRAQAVITDVLEVADPPYTRFMNWGGTSRWTSAGYSLVTN